ncbi:hypothetical protein [Niastella vici]|nr:hypothetical protein [Niastella vici]
MRNVRSLALVAICVLAGAVLFTISCKKSAGVKSSLGEPQSGELLSQQGSKAFCNAKASGRVSTNSTARSVELNTTIYNTDFVSAGVSGLRNVGAGAITLGGVSGTITKALLYWHGVTNSTVDAGSTITVNGTPVTGTNLGYSNDNCWGYNNSQAYKADVTALVTATGNGNYALAGFGDLNPNGASLIVFFKDADATNNRDVVIFEGNDSNQPFAGIAGNPNAPADPEGWDVTLAGINYTTGTANVQMHVSDGQTYADGEITVNDVQLVPAGAVFQGNTVPQAVGGSDLNGRLWDIRSWDITSFLTPGPNTLHVVTHTNNDCLGLIVALIDLPAGAAPVTEITVPFDVRPGGCPNPFNPDAQGVLPVAILGTADFDVTKIDPSTLKINGVALLRSAIQDVATPFTGTLTDCASCSSAGADGRADLTVKFDFPSISATVVDPPLGACLDLTITGNLKAEFGGTPIKGTDKIVIVGNKK